MLDFVAIDFETATSKYDSACSVAVVEVKNGRQVDSFYSLIRPPQLCFLPYNIKIHGITPIMVQHEPDFRGIWEDLRNRLAGRMVVAHNASFDMGVLRACLKTYGLAAPNFRYCCTVSLSQKAWPDLCNHKLDTVGAFLDIKFNHHNAFDDAKTCAAIPVVIAGQMGVESFEDMAGKLGVNIRRFVC